MKKDKIQKIEMMMTSTVSFTNCAYYQFYNDDHCEINMKSNDLKRETAQNHEIQKDMIVENRLTRAGVNIKHIDVKPR